MAEGKLRFPYGDTVSADVDHAVVIYLSLGLCLCHPSKKPSHRPRHKVGEEKGINGEIHLSPKTM